MVTGTLGLIVVGDYALATGADQHVAFVAALLGKTGRSLAFAWFVPAGRVPLAGALHEAWQRPQTVACFGGLGRGIDDHVRVTISALQTGREEMGLHRHPMSDIDDVLACANTVFFPGQPLAAHTSFERWWIAQALDSGAAGLPSTERVHWTLPESLAAADARRSVKADHPTVAQRLTAGTKNAEGEVMLTFTGTSKGKTQAARKALQRLLAARGSHAPS